MKEITFNEAIAMPYLMIDMVTPVKDYEKYDFHRGMKCSINGFTFELMAENGELSLEAEAIVLTAHNQRRRIQIPTFVAGETIAVIELYNGYAKCHIAALPTRITHQSFTLNFA